MGESQAPSSLFCTPFGSWPAGTLPSALETYRISSSSSPSSSPYSSSSSSSSSSWNSSPTEECITTHQAQSRSFSLRSPTHRTTEKTSCQSNSARDETHHLPPPPLHQFSSCGLQHHDQHPTNSSASSSPSRASEASVNQQGRQKELRHPLYSFLSTSSTPVPDGTPGRICPQGDARLPQLALMRLMGSVSPRTSHATEVRPDVGSGWDTCRSQARLTPRENVVDLGGFRTARDGYAGHTEEHLTPRETVPKTLKPSKKDTTYFDALTLDPDDGISGYKDTPRSTTYHRYRHTCPGPCPTNWTRRIISLQHQADDAGNAETEDDVDDFRRFASSSSPVVSTLAPVSLHHGNVHPPEDVHPRPRDTPSPATEKVMMKDDDGAVKEPQSLWLDTLTSVVHRKLHPSENCEDETVREVDGNKTHVQQQHWAAMASLTERREMQETTETTETTATTVLDSRAMTLICSSHRHCCGQQRDDKSCSPKTNGSEEEDGDGIVQTGHSSRSLSKSDGSAWSEELREPLLLLGSPSNPPIVDAADPAVNYVLMSCGPSTGRQQEFGVDAGIKKTTASYEFQASLALGVLSCVIWIGTSTFQQVLHYHWVDQDGRENRNGGHAVLRHPIQVPILFVQITQLVGSITGIIVIALLALLIAVIDIIFSPTLEEVNHHHFCHHREHHHRHRHFEHHHVYAPPIIRTCQVAVGLPMAPSTLSASSLDQCSTSIVPYHDGETTEGRRPRYRRKDGTRSLSQASSWKYHPGLSGRVCRVARRYRRLCQRQWTCTMSSSPFNQTLLSVSVFALSRWCWIKACCFSTNTTRVDDGSHPLDANHHFPLCAYFAALLIVCGVQGVDYQSLLLSFRPQRQPQAGNSSRLLDSMLLFLNLRNAMILLVVLSTAFLPELHGACVGPLGLSFFVVGVSHDQVKMGLYGPIAMSLLLIGSGSFYGTFLILLSKQLRQALNAFERSTVYHKLVVVCKILISHHLANLILGVVVTGLVMLCTFIPSVIITDNHQQQQLHFQIDGNTTQTHRLDVVGGLTLSALLQQQQESRVDASVIYWGFQALQFALNWPVAALTLLWSNKATNFPLSVPLLQLINIPISVVVASCYYGHLFGLLQYCSCICLVVSVVIGTCWLFSPAVAHRVLSIWNSRCLP